jgi:hypothetical protein
VGDFAWLTQSLLQTKNLEVQLLGRAMEMNAVKKVGFYLLLTGTIFVGNMYGDIALSKFDSATKVQADALVMEKNIDSTGKFEITVLKQNELKSTTVVVNRDTYDKAEVDKLLNTVK